MLPLTALTQLLGNPASSTKAAPVTEMLHGEKITDAFRWLEGDNTNPLQMGKMTPEVAAWTDAQNARTRSILDNLPGRAALEAKLRPLMEVGSVSLPVMRKNFYFYTRREGAQSQPILYVREGHRGKDRVLLDVSGLAKDGLTALAGYWPDPSGELIAVGTYYAGDEETTVNVIRVKTGEWLADEAPGKTGSVEWLPDSTGFFYRNLEDVKDPYSGQIMFHRLGTHSRFDRRLFRQYTKEQNEKLATTWGPSYGISRDARWLLLQYWTGTSSNDLWVVDLDRWFRTGEFIKREIAVGLPSTFSGQVLGDALYMRTNFEASKGRVVKVDLHDPRRESWRDVIPENPNATLDGFSIGRGLIAVDYSEKAATRIRLFDLEGGPKGELKLPGIGSAGFAVEEDRTEAFVQFTSFNYPPTVFRVDLAAPQKELAVWERPDAPVDPGIAEVKQETYASKDGTDVTMFVVHKKGLKLDGTNPAWLYGYGGFNISMTPIFSATLFPWIEAGGVYAVANLRGGGEYGQAWHKAGMLERKQNVFDDCIAAAEHLVKRGYTNPNRLAVTGGSNGGLLTGAMLTQRPDLFRAVIVGVPLLDMLRYQHFLMARYWTPEYGDAESSPEAFRWLKNYSPYHQVKQGMKYPAVYLTAGENDMRVHPMHARKMAAALQSATASDPVERPVLLWVDREAGHGQGKPLHLRIRDAVDARIFLMWQLGMLPK